MFTSILYDALPEYVIDTYVIFTYYEIYISYQFTCIENQYDELHG